MTDASAAKPSAGVSPPGMPEALGAVIQRAKRELERMMDLNPQAMLLVDRSGRVARLNQAALTLLGRRGFRDVIDTRLVEQFPACGEAFFEELIEQGGERLCEVSVGGATGPRRLRFMAVGRKQETDIVVVIVDDVTDVMAKLATTEKKHKREAVEALMGALMHNINQPLTVIMVTASMLQLSFDKGAGDVAETRRSMETIMDAAMRISKLLESVKIPKDFVTEEYIDGVQILDIVRSSGEE